MWLHLIFNLFVPLIILIHINRFVLFCNCKNREEKGCMTCSLIYFGQKILFLLLLNNVVHFSQVYVMWLHLIFNLFVPLIILIHINRFVLFCNCKSKEEKGCMTCSLIYFGQKILFLLLLNNVVHFSQVYVMWLHLIFNLFVPLIILIYLNTAIYKKLNQVQTNYTKQIIFIYLTFFDV